jgi:RimJ/RimL family protein N-acetyltransferase
MATAFITSDVAPERPVAETREPSLVDPLHVAMQGITARPSITGWRSAPPVLVSGNAWLREPERRDADALCRALTAVEPDPFLAEVLPTPKEFERFITWVRAERVQGRIAAFVVGECGGDRAAGLFEVWPLDRDRGIAGLFIDAAPLLLDYVFDRLGVTRLEARTPAQHQRGSAALRQLGARRLGSSPAWDGHCVWVIDAHRWRAQRRGCFPESVGPMEPAR